jgi:hypothetical protein
MCAIFTVSEVSVCCTRPCLGVWYLLFLQCTEGSVCCFSSVCSVYFLDSVGRLCRLGFFTVQRVFDSLGRFCMPIFGSVGGFCMLYLLQCSGFSKLFYDFDKVRDFCISLDGVVQQYLLPRLYCDAQDISHLSPCAVKCVSFFLSLM